MGVSISTTEKGNADALLSRLPIALREKHLKKALRSAGKIVAKEARLLAPKPGYPGDKPGLTPLQDTIIVVLREYQGGEIQSVFVGPSYPAGAHGHLVEFGHMLIVHGQHVGQVPPHPFLRPAADLTTSHQQNAIETTIKKGIESEIR